MLNRIQSINKYLESLNNSMEKRMKDILSYLEDIKQKLNFFTEQLEEAIIREMKNLLGN